MLLQNTILMFIVRLTIPLTAITGPTNSQGESIFPPLPNVLKLSVANVKASPIDSE
jgi:hypothetical protein